MKVVSKINNNVAVCIDGNGSQLIAFGKGIGFPPVPYELTDITKIEHSYYEVNSKYLPLINEIPATVFDVSHRIVAHANDLLRVELNPNLVFTLADHIAFSLARYKKGLTVRMPAVYDVALTYPQETEVARYALELIDHSMNVSLPESELSGLVLNILNAEMESDSCFGNYNEAELTNSIADMISERMHQPVDRTSFNYARFATHLRYLYMRLSQKILMQENHRDIYLSLKTRFPDIDSCVNEISDILGAVWKLTLKSDERLYLLLHIERLLTREHHREP